MTPRRVAYILKIFPKLSETFIANELAELRGRGVDLAILSLLPPREEPTHEFIVRAGLRELACYEPGRFAEVLQKFKPDILHAHFATESTAAAMELSATYGVPFTFTCHGYDIYRKPPADFAARAIAARAVVTVSKANAAHLVRNLGLPDEHIRVIPCGVDASFFQPNGLGGKSEIPLLVCVARLVQVKNLGLLLRSCAVLRDRNVKFRCVLVGEGPLRPELQGMRAQLGLDQFVQMPGAVEQTRVLKYWQEADVGVLTSSSEGMPVSLMEAGACGVPVVATAVGGVPELIEHEKTGLLVSPGDVTELARALERLLADQALRTRLGGNARLRATTAFSIRRQVDALLGLWTEILNGGPS
jgi:glycosyltransferase involved in cell wall biosynthesis